VIYLHHLRRMIAAAERADFPDAAFKMRERTDVV
jgi:hypothetical protein